MLDDDPEARARFEKLKDFEKDMCYSWIADALTPCCASSASTWPGACGSLFDPYYEIGPDLMLPVDDLYGSPGPFRTFRRRSRRSRCRSGVR